MVPFVLDSSTVEGTYGNVYLEDGVAVKEVQTMNWIGIRIGQEGISQIRATFLKIIVQALIRVQIKGRMAYGVNWHVRIDSICLVMAKEDDGRGRNGLIQALTNVKEENIRQVRVRGRRIRKIDVWKVRDIGVLVAVVGDIGGRTLRNTCVEGGVFQEETNSRLWIGIIT